MESELVACAFYIQNEIKSCGGDVGKLKDQVLSDYASRKYAPAVFHKVLDDNIAACSQAGYVNKEKILKFVKTCLENEERVLAQQAQQAGSLAEALAGADLNETSSTYHAPKFVDDEICKRSTSAIT